MTRIEDARDDLHTFAAGQGWSIRSDIVAGDHILATIRPGVEVCSDCKREIVAGDFASLGKNMVLCNDCYEG